jgi:SSS family solute:Na+ symporter
MSKQSRNHEALIATIIGVLVILWMTFPQIIPVQYAFLRNTMHSNMIIVIGTLTIFLVGVLLTKYRQTK